MADERIDIEIVDKVSPQIGPKLEKIAAAAREADTHIVNLQKALAAVKPAQINNLATAETKAAIAAKNLERATTSAATAQQRLATETIHTATAEKKLERSTATAAAAQKRLAVETSNAAAAETRAATAALRLDQAQKKAAASASKSSFSFSAMNGYILAATAAIGSLWGALSIADDFANLQNRLRSTGLEGESLTEVMGKLKDSANNTRSSLQGTVELYSRLAVSSSELGVTQDQLIGFTTSLNQAILLSGASAEEAQAGLIQLSQGMASGTLRGDELRSVLEQLPAVADVIANSLGVTRGQLRQMGEEGKITAQTILKAFQEAGPELGERFAGQATTAGQAMEVLKNKTLELAGKEGKGSLDQFTGTIVDLTKSLDDLKPVLSGVAWLFETISKTVRVLFLGVQSIFTGVLPLMFSCLGQLMTGFNETLISWVKKIVAVSSYILPDAVGNGLKSMVSGLETYNADSLKWFKEIESNAVDSMARISDTFAEIYAYKPPEAGGQTPEAVLAAGAERRRKEAETAEKARKAAEEAAKAAKTRTEELAKLDKQARQDSNEAAEKAYRDALAKADGIAKAYADIRAEVDNMHTVLGMTDKELSVHNALLGYREKLAGAAGSEEFLARIKTELEAIYDQNKALERQKQILERVKRTDFNTAMSDLSALGTSKKISQEQRQDYLIAQSPDLFAGTAEATEANIRSYEDMYARIGAMREANDISEVTAAQMRTKVWIAENESKLESASSFFGAFAALQTSTWKELAAVGKAAAIAQATIDGILSVQKALASYPPPVSYAMAASAAAAAAINVAKITGVAGFETGGYTGNVGRSSVAGVVHGQEYVMDADTVKRIGVDNLDAMRSGAAMVQQPNGPVISGGSGASTQNVNQTRIINVIDPGMVADWMNTPEGEKAVLNIIRNNSDTMRQTVNG